MGADGGIKLQRKDLIKQNQTSKYDEFKAHEYNRIGKWSSCTLTNKPLDIPIVSDYKGNLYNKESILEYLLNPEEFTSSQKSLLSHIKSLKDIVELKIQKQSNDLICPLTGNILGSNGIPYIYLVKCHDTFAKKCLSTINKDITKCPVCDLEYSKEDDIIVINPESKEDIINQEERMKKLESSGLTHSLKKLKKQKKRKERDEPSVESKLKKVKN